MSSARTSSATPVLVTVRQAGIRLGVSPETLRAAIQRGELVAYQTGQRWLRVEWAQVLVWLARHRRAPASSDALACGPALPRSPS